MSYSLPINQNVNQIMILGSYLHCNLTAHLCAALDLFANHKLKHIKAQSKRKPQYTHLAKKKNTA